MRLLFGGTPADVFLVDEEAGGLGRAGGAVARFYDSKDGGVQYVDLRNLADGEISSVTTSTGGDGWSAGQLPFFFGPDGVFEMFVQVADAPRVLITAANLGSYLGPVRAQLEDHLAPENRNPHGSRLRDLADVAGATLDPAPPGSVIVKDEGSGLWVAGPATVGGGGSGDVTTGTDQTITGKKTFTGAAGKTAVVFRANTGQAANLWECWSSADDGQGGEPQLTGYGNEKGEGRFIAAKHNSTPLRAKAQPGQTANVFEVTDLDNNPKTWVGPNYAFYAPNSGRTVPFTALGAVAAGAGKFFWTNDLGVSMAFRSVRLRSAIAPTGQSIIVDLKVNGVSVFASGSRPAIPSGQTNSGRITTFLSTIIPVGAELTADILQVGNPVTGSDLTCQIELW